MHITRTMQIHHPCYSSCSNGPYLLIRHYSTSGIDSQSHLETKTGSDTTTHDGTGDKQKEFALTKQAQQFYFNSPS